MLQAYDVADCGSKVYVDFFPVNVNSNRLDYYVASSRLTTFKELQSVMSTTFALREETGTLFVDALLLGLKECSAGDWLMIRKWKMFKYLCETSVKISRHVLKTKGSDRTFLNTCDQLSFVVFHLHPADLLRAQIKFVGTNGIVFFSENDVPKPSHSLHTKNGETIRQFVANEVQRSIS